MKSRITLLTNQYLYSTKRKFSTSFKSASHLILERDAYFKNLLTSKTNFTSDEITNIARVLGKSKQSEITKDEEKKFDNLALENAKRLDPEELRQVINYYIKQNRSNSAVFYELNQRHKTVGYQNYHFKDNSIHAKFYNYLFDWRNYFFKKISNLSGIKLK